MATSSEPHQIRQYLVERGDHLALVERLMQTIARHVQVRQVAVLLLQRDELLQKVPVVVCDGCQAAAEVGALAFVGLQRLARLLELLACPVALLLELA